MSKKHYLYSNFSLVRKLAFFVGFVKYIKYWPNFKNPKTFNEKINYRKKHIKSELYSLCSDKVLVKDWVEEQGYPEILIENYGVFEHAEFEKVKSIIVEKGDILLKANHNSGPVHLLTKLHSDDEIRSACESVNTQLKHDYGRLTGENWYSAIPRKVLIERRLHPEVGEHDLKDFKFHIFKSGDGNDTVLLHIDFDRKNQHNRSFFSRNLSWLPFSLEYPSIKTSITKPKNYEKMVEIALKLAEPFSYVRVDLYNIDGEIYFGELTFAHGSGRELFSSLHYDKWMGSLWGDCNEQ